MRPARAAVASAFRWTFSWSVAAVLLCAAPLDAQQGSLQIGSSTQITTGDVARRGAQRGFEPDIGLSFVQPGLRLGTLQIDARLVRREDQPRLGRAFLAVRDFIARGLTWNLEGGDAYLRPSVSEYGFTNLFAPPVTFRGLNVSGANKASFVGVTAGRVTALRNIFGSDADPLGQSLLIARATHRPAERVEIFSRASRVRTTDVKEFGYFIRSSAEVGGGIRYLLTPSVDVIADAGVSSYVRRGARDAERDGSLLAGARWTLPRGWMQVNAQRFSPGQFPVVNFSLNDRAGVFGAGEYDIGPHLRAFAGVDVFKTNLKPESADLSPIAVARGAGSRAFGGVRAALTDRSFLTIRLEDGARTSQLFRSGTSLESDSGALAAEWQGASKRWNAFARYERRTNVELGSGTGTFFTEHNTSAQLFRTLAGSKQVFFSVLLGRRSDGVGGGQTSWELAGGGQMQLPGRDLYVRAQGIAGRNLDLGNEISSSRQALNGSLTGQLGPQLSVAFDLFIDRAPLHFTRASPWVTRTMIRVTRSFRTGTAMRRAEVTPTAARGRASGSIAGSVFADWNGNALADMGEENLEGVTFTLNGAQPVVTGADGRFTFVHVPTGSQSVELDLSALPVTFDPPVDTRRAIEVSKGTTAEAHFGLLPLGSIRGGVYQDVNGDGSFDPGDQPMEEAVLILDDGARSELAVRGRFQFDNVRPGPHAVALLLDSLPAGAIVAGEPRRALELTRDRMRTEVIFLVKVEKRKEIRRVFPAKPPR